jgi:hypothetical protein
MTRRYWKEVLALSCLPLLSVSTRAEDVPNVCLSIPGASSTITAKTAIAGYWANAIDDRHIISFDGVTDLATGETKKFEEYEVDPYPTPDGKWITEPGLEFFETKDFLRQGKKAPLILRDPGVRGVYHSIGMTSEKGGQTTYRAINRSFFGQQYQPDFSSVTPKLIPFGKRLKLCFGERPREPRMYPSTPILSKDGRYLAYETVDSQESRSMSVYEVNWNTGECKFKRTLGSGLSKVQFNFRGNLVVFRKRENGTGEGASAVVMDLETGRKLTIPPGSKYRTFSSPTFLPNGKLVLIESSYGEKNLGEPTLIREIDVNRFFDGAKDEPSNQVLTCKPNSDPTEFLGDLLRKVCQIAFSKSELLKIAKDFSRADCQETVRAYVKTLPADKINRVSLAAYLAACPSDN